MLEQGYNNGGRVYIGARIYIGTRYNNGAIA